MHSKNILKTNYITMNTILWPSRGQDRPAVSKVITQIGQLFRNKDNETTVIMADYDKKFIRNTINTKLQRYKKNNQFWTVEFKNREWRNISFKQDSDIVVHSIDNHVEWAMYLNKENILSELEKRI